MRSASPEKRLLGHVIGLAASSFMVGLFFMQALYEGVIRRHPLAYLYALGVVVLSVVVFVHGRRILREAIQSTGSSGSG